MTIKELRTEQNMSQAEFAKTIGVSSKSIGAYENGRTNPSEQVLQKIKDVYGVVLTATTKAAAVVADKAAKVTAAAKENADKAAKNVEKKAAAKKVKTQLIIQSPMGGVITPEEILAKVGPADQIYVRVDENKAYWVRGEESGSVDLW